MAQLQPKIDPMKDFEDDQKAQPLSVVDECSNHAVSEKKVSPRGEPERIEAKVEVAPERAEAKVEVAPERVEAKVEVTPEKSSDHKPQSPKKETVVEEQDDTEDYSEFAEEEVVEEEIVEEEIVEEEIAEEGDAVKDDKTEDELEQNVVLPTETDLPKQRDDSKKQKENVF